MMNRDTLGPNQNIEKKAVIFIYYSGHGAIH